MQQTSISDSNSSGNTNGNTNGSTPHFERYRVIRRDSREAPFRPEKIAVAISKAFLAAQEQHEELSARHRELINRLTNDVVDALTRRRPSGGELHIEEIQDQVELALMRAGEQNVARRYVLYREERTKARETPAAPPVESAPHLPQVLAADGTLAPLDLAALQTQIAAACAELSHVDADALEAETLGGLYDEIPLSEVRRAAIMAARARIETAPEYAFAAARLLLDELCVEVLAQEISYAQAAELYAAQFPDYIAKGIAAGRLTAELGTFDLQKISAALRPERDLQFAYMGLQTLYDRYLIHIDGQRIELPQWFWMRVAMGLAQREIDREARTIEFYEIISRFRFVPSTPTLFNSGTAYPQLSSCYLTTIGDDLGVIYDAIRDNALLSKFSGGLGNDWTPVRAMGAHINSTNGQSQGIVPFLKVANDTAVAVNQCFAPDTKIWTQRGVQSIECLNVGDLVLGHDAEYRAVTEVMEYVQDGPMVELRIKHASGPLRVTAGHPLLALRGLPLEASNERAYQWLEKGKVQSAWVEAAQLQTGDYVAQVVPREVVPVDAFTAQDARFYGLMLGDGHQTSHRREWGLSFNNETGQDSMAFAHDYLSARGINYHSAQRGSYTQIKWSTHKTNPAAQLPFSHDDLYCCTRRKRIAPRFLHLPKDQTLQLLRGLVEADGNVSRGSEITFSNTSEELAEGVRYQMLRLGVPTAARRRTREYSRLSERSDGSPVLFEGTSTEWVVPLPAIPELAELVGCRALKKRNWLTRGHHVFTRVKKVKPFKGTPLVYDLKVEGAESYMTVNGLAHNGGKRQGAVCAYIEPWHSDVEEFLDLRKNTGDDRRRTHDMHTALWIPDLFLQRVAQNGAWTLFSPDETPDLHDLVGRAFAQRYEEYEAQAARDEMRTARTMPAAELWRKVLTRLFETGHPWITFKDAANLRSPQQHCGVVHSSNLCTEITLNTSRDEIAVCNLGSINLAAHTTRDGFDQQMLGETARVALRMLDNVIDINLYPVPQARASNLRHRPVGLGIMGFQDALHMQRISYGSEAAMQFADETMEAVSYHAILASTELAKERGSYASFKGSLWDQGVLPLDSLRLLDEARGETLEIDRASTCDWEKVRAAIAEHGMRNSNCMAIAPTATISNIAGVSASIEPNFANLFAKSNLSGEFTVINPYLVEDLRALGLWDKEMVDDLKYFDGILAEIDRIPVALQALYATAFEIEPQWLIEAASRRQKWIDMGQSLNLYVANPSGPQLAEMYFLAWRKGLKTTYYLRSKAATQVEKSTLDINRKAIQPRWMKSESPSSRIEMSNSEPAPSPDLVPVACSLDGDCEACQ